MTPSARLSAAIELLEDIESSLSHKGKAADVLVRNYFRKRRYAGSSDRNAITDLVYDVIRNRGVYMWRLMSAGCPITVGDMALLALFLKNDGFEPDLFEGPYAQDMPDAERLQRLERAANLTNPPSQVLLNVPDWLADHLDSRFGDTIMAEVAALSGRASVDLRVNSLKADRESMMAALAGAGIVAVPTPFSPYGIRLEKPFSVNELLEFREGKLEVQGEASQIASLLCGVKEKEQVMDLCAGAGGKALALGAIMRNSGQIYAMDTDKKRLNTLKSRCDRAGLTNIQIHRLTSGAKKRAGQLYHFANSMDLVVVDAPCSGSGTWRRSPELRWRLEEDDMADLVTTQRTLLLEAMDLARPGGRIAYMTCSVLEMENEGVIDYVLGRRHDWALMDYHRVADTVGLRDLPETASHAPEMLLLTPARHGTDGFFLALLSRSAD